VRFAKPTAKNTADHRRQFRASLTVGESLALDPGGGGLIASVLAGSQPSPQAFGFWADSPGPLEFDPEAMQDGIAILCISGPIEHHAHPWWHSYEAIAEQIECAMQCSAARAVVLKIDSPGGVAAGMGETHRAIRMMQKQYKKDCYAFGDELMCSAAFNIGSACREIWTTPEGHCGSVGVILCTIDETKRLEKDGVAIEYLVTGARKADLHPGTAITSDVKKVAQSKVDKLGRHFWSAVAKARAHAGLDTPEKVAALQAGVFVGTDAVNVGLADGVASWKEFLRLVNSASDNRR
jgi:capsid assembly protease